MAQVLSAAPVIAAALQDLEKRCQALRKKGIIPTMKVFLVGEHPASVLYTNNKQKFCRSFGAECEILKLAANISAEDFMKQVKAVGNDPLVHGCFVQLPLPEHLQTVDVGNLIPPSKDVDGFHDQNLVALLRGQLDRALVPCTPKGVLSLLDFYQHPVAGKKIVIIGRSLIVGKPLSLLLTEKNATVTLCHSRTANLKDHTLNADIIISAVGKSRYLTQEHVRHDKSQVLIDVGINHDEFGVLCGDMDYANLEAHCKAITPVPGGVGKMTILSLAQNLLQATENSL